MLPNPNNWIVMMESFRQKGELLHGWGTLRGSGEIPCAVWLESALSASGEKRGIRAVLAKVSRSTQKDEASVDFILYGADSNIGQTPATLYLFLEWQDGSRLRLPLPAPRQAPPGRGITRLARLPWKHYFSRGWRLLRQGQSGLLLRKMAGMSHALLASGWRPERLLAWAGGEGKALALVIDHDLGGGANLYRRTQMSHLAVAGFMPLLLSAHHGILAYQLTAQRGKRTRSAHIDGLRALFALLSQTDIRQVVFNNILSFPAPLMLVRELSGWLQENRGVRFTFLVHDYYSICPVWLLLDHTGKFCRIPEPSVCKICLHANSSPFLEFASDTDIAQWRAAWGSLLSQAAEIRCFSNSSKEILQRAHPALDPARISIVPHSLEHVRLRKPALLDRGQPIIGVIGHIAMHKGARVVHDLAQHIAARGAQARIVIIGTIELELPVEITTITGPYRPEELPALIERHGVNIGLFPSVCPETFSYVAEEMMMMDLPLLAFDLGAPGERVAAYHRGMTIPVGDPGSVLAAIETLYRAHIKQHPLQPPPQDHPAETGNR